MEDTAIIRLFQERSQQAIAELSQKYGKLCQSLSRRILNNEEDAKECVNDTWLGVWNSIPPQTPNPLVSYVCRITRNLSVKRLRHNMAAKRNSYYDVSLATWPPIIPYIPAFCASTEKALTILQSPSFLVSAAATVSNA